MRNRLHFSIRTIMCIALCMASAAAMVKRIANGYHQDRSAILDYGDQVAFHRRGECLGNVMAGEWRLVGELEWTGPTCLEQPMRKAGIPWFDRVTGAYLCDYNADELQRIVNLCSRPRLRTLWFDPLLPETDLANIRLGIPSRIKCKPLY
jgi:hypothetical protein